MRVIVPILCLLLVAGCAELRLPWTGTAAPDAAEAEPLFDPEDATEPLALGAAGQTVAALDRATDAERAAAQAGAGQEGLFLGETLASLGAPGETGFWLETGLVREPVQGRIEAASGQSVGVELRPSGREPGSGSQISLSAMRALDLPLTALASLRVYSVR